MNPLHYPNVVIYHKNCFDGMCSAWIYQLWLKLNNISLETVQFIPMTHSNVFIPESAVKGKVLMLDFCYDDQKMLDQLISVSESVLLLDHHESTNSLDLSKIISDIDMNRSGAQITWDLFIGYPRHPLVDYIGDRDMWVFALPNSKQVCAYIYSRDISFETFDTLSKEWNFDEFSRVGKILVDFTNIQVKSISEAAYSAHFIAGDRKYLIKCIDYNHQFRSDVGDYIMEKYIDEIDFVLLYTYYANTKIFVVSLRGKDKVNLCDISKHFLKGGGHFNAASFSVDNLDMITPV